MRTNQEIVQEMIIDNPQVQNTFNTITNHSPWKDDLYAEIILIFMKMKNSKLNKLYKKGGKQFNYYFASIAKNQLHSSTSPFYKKYRKDLDDNLNIDTNDLFYTEDDEYENVEVEPTLQVHEWDVPYEDQVAILYDQVKHELHWYDRSIFEMFVQRYNEKGTIRRIAEETGIPEQSVGNTIRNVRALLKSRIGKLMEYEL